MTDPEISAKLAELQKLCGEAAIPVVGPADSLDSLRLKAIARIKAEAALAAKGPAFVALLKEGFSLHRLCDVPECFEGGPASVLPHCVTCGTSFDADSFWPCPTRLSLEKALEETH